MSHTTQPAAPRMAVIDRASLPEDLRDAPDADLLDYARLAYLDLAWAIATLREAIDRIEDLHLSGPVGPPPRAANAMTWEELLAGCRAHEYHLDPWECLLEAECPIGWTADVESATGQQVTLPADEFRPSKARAEEDAYYRSLLARQPDPDDEEGGAAPADPPAPPQPDAVAELPKGKGRPYWLA